MTRARLGLAAAVAAVGLSAWFSLSPAQKPTEAKQAEESAQPAAAGSNAAKATPVSSQGSPAGGGGLTAFIDPQTGQLRQPEPGEMQALLPAAAASTAPVQQFAVPGGGVGAILGEEHMTFSTATRNKDGKIVLGHATGKAEAEAILKAPQQSEVQDVR